MIKKISKNSTGIKKFLQYNSKQTNNSGGKLKCILNEFVFGTGENMG